METGKQALSMLETKRLYLRNLEPSDLDSIYDYRNKEACNKYQRWDAFTRDEIASYIKQFQTDVFLSEKKEQHFAICSKEQSELVGELAYFYVENDCITLGITISYHYHNRGFASEIMEEVIRQIREKYPSMDIVGLIEKENAKSIRLVEKLGFKLESYADSISSYVYVLYGE